MPQRETTRRYAVFIALQLALLALTLAGTACDPGEAVYIENRTPEPVGVFDDGTQRNIVAPGDTARYGILKFEGTMTFTVRTLGGRELARRTFTWDEIKEEDGLRIVIEE